MSSYSVNEPSNRVKWVAGTLVIAYALITMIPLVWIAITGFKSPADAIAYPPKYIIGSDSEAGFQPTLEGYVNLFTTRTRQTEEFLAANPPENWADEIVRQYDLLVQRLNERGIEFDLNGSIGGVVKKGANLWFGYSIFCKRSLSHTTN